MTENRDQKERQDSQQTNAERVQESMPPEQSSSSESDDQERSLTDLPEEVGEKREVDVDISTDDLFRTLAAARNRYVLTYLLLESRPVPLYELVEYVVSNTEPPEGYSPAEFRGRVSTELYESTCPKLDDVGLVEFDEKKQIVRETNKTVVTLPYLRLALKRAERNEA